MHSSRFLCLLSAALLVCAGCVDAETNVALNKPTEGDVAFGYPTANGNDGSTDTFTHADNANPPPDNPYWLVDLQGIHDLTRVEIVDRIGCCDPNRLNGSTIRFFDDAQAQLGTPLTVDGLLPDGPAGSATLTFDNNGAGWQGVAYVRIDGASQYFQFSEFRAFTAGSTGPGTENVALGKPVTASAATWSAFTPGLIADGNPETICHPAVGTGTLGYYFQIDLQNTVFIDRIELQNRGDGCCPERLSNYRVTLFEDNAGSPGAAAWTANVRTDGTNSGTSGIDTLRAAQGTGTFSGRFVRIENRNSSGYSPQIAEVSVYAAPLPAIDSFRTDYGNITATGAPGLPASATLAWTVGNADSLTISGIGPVSGPSGSVVVSPAVTTTYTLTATNTSGQRTATVTIGVDEPEQPPVLTEFLADNNGGLTDEDGDKPDWIEIYNPNPFPLNLGGFYLTDNATVLTKWTFPPVSVPAGSYQIVFASGKNRNDPASPLHTNFNLSRDGEYLALIGRDGTTVLGQFPADYPATAAFPAQGTGISYGIPAGGGSGFLSPPTPGAANGPGYAGFVDGVAISLDRGFYNTPQTATLSTGTPGATIRYTTNGSSPSATSGTVYTAPLNVTRTTVLRAIAVKEGYTSSPVATRTWIFVSDVITSAVMKTAITQHATYGPQMAPGLTSLPAMSIVTPSTINGNTEVKASLEFIQPDGSPGFQEDCGVKNFGGAFTDFPKKSFRLYFRSGYGAAKLKFPLFAQEERGGIEAVEEFDQLNLRSGSHDMKQRGFYLSNSFTDDAMLDMGNINPHGRYVHLYLNGTYWGLYHLRERWHAPMLARHLGGTPEDYESINGNWNVGGWAVPGDPYDGDGSAWTRVKSLYDNYEAVRPYLDVRHYVDYMLLFLSGNSEDEYRCVGPKEAGSGLKWFLNDADGFTRAPGNRTARGAPGRLNGDGPGSIFSMLVKEGHPDFKVLLADRIHALYFNDGPLTPARNTARLQRRVDEVQTAMTAEIARWAGSGSNDSWPTPANWLSTKNSYQNSILPGLTNTMLGYYRSAGFYPATAAPVFNQQGGPVVTGFRATLSAPTGTIYYTVDGTDPRLPGGAISPTARQYDDGTLTTTLVPRGGAWKYLDSGADLGPSDVTSSTPGFSATNWKHPAYDDSTWKTGNAELGYGEGDEATVLDYGPSTLNRYLTTWFRKSFTLNGASDVLSASLEIKRDDGAIIYLNGREIVRTSMPAGVVTSTTQANTASDDGKTFLAFNVPPDSLTEGTNVIAVQLHQATPDSSDLSFDFSLTMLQASSGAAPDLTLSANAWVRARAKNGSEWSAQNDAFFAVGGAPAVAPGDVVVSAIHYHPADTKPGEFLELRNVSGHAVSLRGARFTSGVEYTFADTFDTVLAAGQRLILTGSLFSFQQTYGLDLPVAGLYAGNLDNDGETLTMESASGTPLFSFAWNDNALWPQSPDGSGHSLVFLGGDPADPANWRASRTTALSPLSPDGIAFTASALADANGNGLADLLDYAMGADAAGPSLAVDESGHLLLTCDRAIGADDARLVWEISTGGTAWSPDLSATASLAVRQDLGTRERLTWRSLQPIPAGSRLLARLRASLVP